MASRKFINLGFYDRLVVYHAVKLTYGATGPFMNYGRHIHKGTCILQATSISYCTVVLYSRD